MTDIERVRALCRQKGIPVSKLEKDLDEVLIKGIITSVDMKKDYCIIHIQNKGDNIGISNNILYILKTSHLTAL